MSKIRITGTHGRGGWTRYAGATLEVAAEGPSSSKIISGFDAARCVEEGLGEWVKDEAAGEAAPAAAPPAPAEAEPVRENRKQK